jgi:hypothetical protein
MGTNLVWWQPGVRGVLDFEPEGVGPVYAIRSALGSVAELMPTEFLDLLDCLDTEMPLRDPQRSIVE